MKRIFVAVLLMLVVPAAMALDGRIAKGMDLTIKDIKAPNELKERLPAAVDEIDSVLVRNKFLFWTGDLNHYMDGTYGSGQFKALDNNGNPVWGIYGRRYFAGFYNDGDGNHLFLGRYSRNKWSAVGWPNGEPGIFGLPYARGGFVLAKPVIRKASISR